MRQYDNKAKHALAVYISLFFLIVMGIVLSGYISYRNFEHEFRQQAERQISAIAELKVNDLVSWHKERLSDAQFLYHNPAFSKLVERYFENTGDVEARELLLDQLEHYMGSTQYDQVRLLDVNGVERFLIPAAPDTLDAGLAVDAARSLRSGMVTFLDFYRDANVGGEIHLTFLVPIFVDNSNNTPLGVLALSINPQTYLYPFMQSWPIPTDTAETLLVRRDGEDVLFLNKLRFGQAAPLTLRFPLTDTDLPAVKAVLGQTGVVEGVDYRDEPVLADVRVVPDSSWSLVSKMDTAEVYAPLRARLWETLLMIGMAIFVAGMALALVWRQQRILFYRTQVEAAEALRESEEKMRSIFRVAPTGIGIVRDRVLVEVNPRITEMTGYTKEELTGQSARILYPTQEEFEWVGSEKYKQIAEKDSGAVETRWQKKDGNIIDVLLSSTPIDLADLSKGVTFTALDITERKRSEESLKENEAIFSSFLEHSPVYVFFKDRDIRSLRLSKNYEQMLGRPINELLGKTMDDLFPSDLAKNMVMDDLRILNEGKRTTVVEELNGSVYETTKFPVLKNGEPYILAGFTLDITARKRAEEALRESEALYRQAIEVANAVPYRQSYRVNGKTIDYDFIGEGIRQITGYGPEEFTEALWDTLTQERFLLKDLTEYSYDEAIERVRSGVNPVWKCEHRIRARDGSIHWVFEAAVELRDQSGISHGSIGMFQDITERKQAEDEIRKLNAELEQRVRERTIQLETTNKELEAFSYSVSHDLRAPLRGIDGWSQALLEDYHDQLDEQGQQYIARVRSETQRMGQLIDDMLKLSRLTRVEIIKKQVDLNTLAHIIAERLQKAEPMRKVDFNIQAGLTAEGDSRLLEVMLTNLLGNAFKFTAKCADAHIEFGQTELQDQRVFFVRDNGAGFDMVYSQKLFGAFQRMHNASEFPGTGIGLATVQRIIHRHGGRVWADAEVGRGATIYFTLG